MIEHDRVIRDAQFWGMRVNFRPLPSLEIGLSRSAQWCGKDRPCDLDTFIDVIRQIVRFWIDTVILPTKVIP